VYDPVTERIFDYTNGVHIRNHRSMIGDPTQRYKETRCLLRALRSPPSWFDASKKRADL
jgi:hypothetical protein